VRDESRRDAAGGDRGIAARDTPWRDEPAARPLADLDRVFLPSAARRGIRARAAAAGPRRPGAGRRERGSERPGLRALRRELSEDSAEIASERRAHALSGRRGLAQRILRACARFHACAAPRLSDNPLHASERREHSERGDIEWPE